MEQLLKILNSNSAIDEFLITDVKTDSKELFFIKNQLQMNRGKSVEYLYVDVYKNFTIGDTKYKGSSSCKLAPNMTVEEMKSKIDNAAQAAQTVKNEYYDLVQPTNTTVPKIESKFLNGDMIDDISQLVKDLFEEDQLPNAFINSVEFFINKKSYRIMNSNGIDISYSNVYGEIELVTEAIGETESIELFEIIKFSDYDKNAIKELIRKELHYASLRANAVPLPHIENIPVILSGTAAEGLFGYYEFKASASSIYQKYHNHQINEDLMESAQGDRLTMTIKPFIKNSTSSRYVDNDGVLLKETTLIKDGILLNYLATKRYADYLNIEPTGSIENMIIDGGRYTEAELKTGPYLELLKFSAFQSDPFTGNFGGEFRLGIYFNGKNKIPVTLGSVSGNLNTCQNEMFFSKEVIQQNNIIVPKCIKFNKMDIAGN